MKKGILFCDYYFPYDDIKKVRVKKGNADWLKEKFYYYINGDRYIDQLKAMKYLLVLEELYPTSEHVFYIRRWIIEFHKFYMKHKPRNLQVK